MEKQRQIKISIFYSIIIFVLLFVTTTNSSVFYYPYVSIQPQMITDINISVHNSSNISSPIMYYRKLNINNWKSCYLTNNTCTIPESFMNKQYIYEFYFNDSGTRFPLNGSFKLAVSVGNESIRELAENRTKMGGDLECDPWKGNYSCEYETFQAWEILGFSNAYWMTGNETYREIAENMALNEYDTYDVFATCDHWENDYDCNTTNAFGENLTASLRQGMLIYSLWYAYQKTGNETIRELAENYTKGKAEDCNVWSNDFVCDTSDGQGAMILGYWKAYEMTGNESYREIAENLSYGNETLDALVLLEGYEQTGSYDRLKKGHEVGMSASDCDVSGGICEDAEKQGRSIYLLWEMYRVINSSTIITINLSAPSVVTTGKMFNVLCYIKNTGNKTIKNGVLCIYTQLEVNNDKCVNYSEIFPEEIKTNSWQLHGSSPGTYNVTCVFTSNYPTVSASIFVTLLSPPSTSLPHSSSSEFILPRKKDIEIINYSFLFETEEYILSFFQNHSKELKGFVRFLPLIINSYY